MWAILVPIPNLRILPEVGGELTIEEVTFISGSKIPRVRKRLGIFKRISEYRGLTSMFAIDASATYAHLRTAKDPEGDLTAEYRLIDDAVYLLASSAFFQGARRMTPPFGRIGANIGLLDTRIVFNDKDGTWRGKSSVVGPHQEYIISKQWKESMARHFFSLLLPILNSDRTLQLEWRAELRRAAILAGKSLYAPRIADAFLLNMIALEVLLTRRGDRFPDAIIERLMTFFGWLTKEDPSAWRTMIRRLYKFRCAMVHDGRADGLRAIDLYNSELLLANALRNLCKLKTRIRSKDDIIELAEKVRAWRVLGMKPVDRPKGVRFTRLLLNDEQLKILEKEDYLSY
jgi:hypothetical protein